MCTQGQEDWVSVLTCSLVHTCTQGCASLYTCVCVCVHACVVRVCVMSRMWMDWKLLPFQYKHFLPSDGCCTLRPVMHTTATAPCGSVSCVLVSCKVLPVIITMSSKFPESLHH